MARAKRKRDRLHQVLNFLRHEFPTAYPMEMRVESIPQKGGELCFGDVALIKGRFLIRIDSRLVWEVAIDILLHEVAHCVAWPHKKLHKERPDHSDEWGLAFARIYRRFHEEDGDLDSYEYPWKTVV